MRRYVAAVVGVSAPEPFEFRGRRYSFAPAAGVANDVRWYKAFFANQIAHQALSLTSLEDGSQTTAAALKLHLRRLAGTVGPGDRFLLALIGHGFQAPDDDSREERDGLDEVFAAADGAIVDDDFASIWAMLPTDAAVVVFADTCSSDSIGIRGGRPPQVIITTGRPGPPRLSIAASRATEKAGTTLTRHGVRGVMSQALEDAWLLPESHGSYEQWFRATAELIAVRRPSQHPVLRFIGPDTGLLDRAPFETVGT